jgi:hypothetical protein
MARKPPPEERRIILARDHRRRYGARLSFRVLDERYLGSLGSVTLLLRDGTFGRLKKESADNWEMGVPYELELAAYASAREAEEAGLRAAQALLLTALSLDFGLRLDYSNLQPATVIDRTVSTGMISGGRMFAAWSDQVVATQLTDDFEEPVRDRRLLLSMELLASSSLEANDRARFITAVSALEPLADAQALGPEVAAFTESALELLRKNEGIAPSLRSSLEGRIHQLKRESVRQSLTRLCRTWFPGDADAPAFLDHVYALRSELLHDGTVSDLDVLLGTETRRIRQYLRQIYEQEFKRTFRSPTAA